MANNTTLRIRDLTFSYDPGEVVLDGVSLDVRPGETVGLIGANGAGKSTLLKLAVGLLIPDAGAIELMETAEDRGADSTICTIDQNGANIATLAKMRRRVGYVFQDAESQLFMTTVAEDVAFAPRNYGCDETEVEARVDRALDLVHARHLRDKPIHKLSGGEKKLVSIATILSTEPDLILLDEPSIALDPANRRNLIRVLDALPCAKLIASHDLDMMLDLCDRVILLDHGSVAGEGDAGALLGDRARMEAHGLELPLTLYNSGQ